MTNDEINIINTGGLDSTKRKEKQNTANYTNLRHFFSGLTNSYQKAFDNTHWGTNNQAPKFLLTHSHSHTTECVEITVDSSHDPFIFLCDLNL